MVKQLSPYFLAVVFTATVTGFFNLSDSLPTPVAVLAGASWGIVLGLVTRWMLTKPKLAAAVEDTLVFLGIVAVAFAACGGVMALIIWNGALDSSSLTGETLLKMFLPTIPFYIVANASLELVIMPVLLLLGWRPGRRRILIVTGAVLYFVLRVWTYVAFVPARLGFADSDRNTAPMTPAERHQAFLDMKLDDPRWILLLVIMAVLIVAVGYPRLREIKSGSASEIMT